MPEVWTDERGQPQARVERAIENALTNAVGRGDIRPEQVDAKRELLRGYAAGRIREGGIDNDAYLTWARATGVLSVMDDPRVRPSWVR